MRSPLANIIGTIDILKQMEVDDEVIDSMLKALVVEADRIDQQVKEIQRVIESKNNIKYYDIYS